MADILTINDRLYVELMPTNETRDYLRTLVTNIKPYINGGLLNDRKWHITLIHFGKVQDILNELKRYAPDLSDDRYIELLINYAENSRTVLPRQTKLQLTGYDLFGPAHNVLVLRFDLTDELKEAHQKALGYLIEFLTACSVSDYAAFIKNSANLHHALGIKPHLTIARRVTEIDDDKFIIEPKTLTFMPADLHGL